VDRRSDVTELVTRVVYRCPADRLLPSGVLRPLLRRHGALATGYTVSCAAAVAAEHDRRKAVVRAVIQPHLA
jgi:hypothetical protein